VIKTSANHGLNKLAHPLIILAVGLIWLNAALLQPASPSWLTGKLVDLAWMVVLPVTAAALLEVFWRGSEKLAFWIPAVCPYRQAINIYLNVGLV
jgi:hypothetical protein